MDIYVNCFDFHILFVVFSHDFIIYVYFIHIAATNEAT